MKSSKLLSLVVFTLASALAAHAQLKWSEYSDSSQTINGTSYAAGALITADVATGGDTLTGGSSATVSFTVPAGARVDFATSNFAPFTLSSANPTLKVAFSMSASGGLTTATRVFSVGLLNSSSAELTHTGYSAIANLSNSGIYEFFSAPAIGATATGGGMLAYNSAAKLASGKSIGFTSFADTTTYSGFFQLKYVNGNVQIGSSSSGANAGISQSNGTATDSAYGTSTSAGYANPAFTVNTFVFAYYNSTAAPVTVTLGGISLEPLGPPTILAQPADVATAAGAPASFSVTAAANPAATYQWYLAGQPLTDGPLPDGSVVSGATTASLTLTNAQLDENGAGAYVVVTNSYGPATSSTATLTVAATATPPAITTQPAGTTVNAGATATFTVAASGSPAPSYQWYFVAPGGAATALADGNGISGSATDTLTLTTVNPTEAGAYYAVATNLGGSTPSASAALTVVNAGPAIQAVTPTGSSAGACIDTPLSITFSSPVVIGTTGTVRIYNAATNALVDTIDVAASGMTAAQIKALTGLEAIAGSKTIEGQSFNYYPIVVRGATAAIYPHVALSYGTSYYVTVDTGVFQDAATGNAFIGIYDSSTWRFGTRMFGPAAGSTWLNVAADGSGDFCTVQGALDFLPANNTTPTTISIAPGTYDALVFDNHRSNVTFLGQSRTGTILQYANNNNFDSAGGSFYHRGAVEAYGNDLSFLNLTIRNTTPHGGSQAEALILIGSRNIVSNVDLYSYQDTFQATGSTYIADTNITGDVDFMWGYGANYFYRCHLTQATSRGYYAQIRNAQPNGTANHGNVYLDCTFDALPGVTGTYLARIDPTPGSGFPYSEVVLIDCALGNNLDPAGWLLNNATSGPDLNWAYAGLTNLSDGTPFDASGWSYAKPLTDATALQNYQTPSYVLNGWTPQLAPVIAAQPVAQTVAGGSGVTLSVTAAGVPDVTYQWELNGTAIAGANGSTYTVASATSATAGMYSVVVSNGTTSVTSTAVPVIVQGGPPVIALQPATTSALLGTTATLNVWALGDGPLAYQWIKDGNPISGATAASLRLTNLQPGDAGSYSVSVTNGGGTTASAAATLTPVAPATTLPASPVIPAGVFDVTAYGAVGDGATDNTAAIQAAINAANAAGGGTVELPPATGAYLSGPLTLSSNTDLQVDGGAILQALPFGTYPKSLTAPEHFLTIAKGATNVELSGAGVIDGNGAPWWSAYDSGAISDRPRLVQITKATNVLITGLTFRNSPDFHLAFSGANSNVTIFGVTISAPGDSPNTDGMDLAGTNFLVQGCSVSDGDDNIVAKPGSVLCQNLYIADCTFGAGHGVSVGGQTNVGLDGMTVTNCTFNGTSTGLRLKADATEGGLVQNVTYSNLTMTNVAYPILFYSYYNRIGTPGAVSGSSQTTPAKVNAWNTTPPDSLATTTIPAWRNITVSNLTATGASGYSTIWGLPLANGLVDGVTLDHVNISGGAGLEVYNAGNVQLTGSTSVGPIITANALALTSQPQDVTVSAGDTVTFNASAVGGSGTTGTTPTYQWARNGVPLTDGTQADGSTVTGATSATLTITNARVTEAGNYTVTASTALDGYDVATSSLVPSSLPVTATSQAATLAVQPVPVTISLSNLTPTYDGTVHAPTVTTTPAGVAVQVAFDGAASPVNAGRYPFTVTVADPNYTAAPVQGTLTVLPAPASVTLSNLEFTYDGTAKVPTITTTPAGLAYAVTYQGQSTPPVTAGSYAVVASVTDPNYTATPATGTLVIDKATPAVVWPQPAAIIYGTPLGATQLDASASVPGTFAYSPAAGTVLNAGPDQALGVLFTPADPTDYNLVATGTTITVNQAPAAISLAGLSQAYDGQPRTVTATTTPAGLAVDLTYGGNATGPVYPGQYPVVATVKDPNYAGTAQATLTVTITALVNHAPTLNGGVDGSVQVLSPESLTLNGDAWISGDLLVPGTPTLRLNGHPTVAGTKDGPGAATPTNYVVTLNGKAVLRYLVRHVNPLALPTVNAPASPAGTRDVMLNSARQQPGDFATIRNLTLNGNAGDIAVPPGSYGRLTANGNSGFILGHAGATQPDVYDLQALVLNGQAHLRLAGPVLLVIDQGVTFNGSVGDRNAPEWLSIAVADGGVTLNGGATLNGFVTAPRGTVIINGRATLTGEVISDRLILNGSAVLREP